MAILRRIGNLFRRTQVDREIDDELQAHIALRTDDNLAAGMSAEESRRDALVRFGNPASTKERITAMHFALLLENIWSDIRYAIRLLIKNPAFAATAIIVLTLGMGSSVAIFAFVDAALIKPLPYKDPTRLVSVYETVASCPLCNISYQNYLDWRTADLPFSSLQAWGWASYLIQTPEGTEPARGARVSDGFFRTLGVTPILGRDFSAGEDAPGAPHTALLGYGAWKKRFGGNRNVIGQTISLSNISYTIVGVLPEGFHFAPLGNVDFWATLNDPSDCDKRRGCHGLFGLARLKDAATLQAAIAGMETEAGRLAQQYPDTNHGYGATAVPLTETVIGDIRPVLLVLLSGALLLLLIACVNVSALLLVRSESRKREPAVRVALGAAPIRLFRQFATEALALVIVGSLACLGSATLAIKLLVKLVPANEMEGMPFLLSAGLNPQVLAFTACLAFLAAAVFALTPALRISRGNLRGDLAEGGRGSVANTWRRLGTRLIVLELATAVVLLVGAGLLGKSFYRLLHVDIGMKTDHLATLIVEVPKPYEEGDRLMVLERQIVSSIGSLPGVKSASISSHRPLRSWDGGVSLVVPGRPQTGERSDVPERDISSGYLSTVGARLEHGRYFTEAEDDEHKPRVAVVNHSFAQQFFPGEDAVGKHVAYEGSKNTVEIIGVIADIKEGQLDTPGRAAMYVPFNQDSWLSFMLAVRTSQAEQALLPTLAASIHQIDPRLATSDEATMTEIMNDSTSAYLHRSSAWLVGGFAAIALLLSVVGVYGVVAYSVSQRTREIGVRMALGAQRGTVQRLVLNEAGRLAAVGVLAGLVCAMAGTTLLRKLLYGTEAWDASTLIAVAVVMTASALLASYLPARRAANIDPIQAMRNE